MPIRYEIRLDGHLDASWSDWLEQMQVTQLECGETILAGWLADQAALYGVLNRLRDLNLPLLAVEMKEQRPKDA